jgi:hypothetical protein
VSSNTTTGSEAPPTDTRAGTCGGWGWGWGWGWDVESEVLLVELVVERWCWCWCCCCCCLPLLLGWAVEGRARARGRWGRLCSLPCCCCCCCCCCCTVLCIANGEGTAIPAFNEESTLRAEAARALGKMVTSPVVRCTGPASGGRVWGAAEANGEHCRRTLAGDGATMRWEERSLFWRWRM